MVSSFLFSAVLLVALALLMFMFFLFLIMFLSLLASLFDFCDKNVFYSKF